MPRSILRAAALLLVNAFLLDGLAYTFSQGQMSLSSYPLRVALLAAVVSIFLLVARDLETLAAPSWKRTLVLVVLLLGVWEGAATVALQRHPMLVRLDPELGTDLTPGFRGSVGRLSYQVSALGFRGDELDPKARYRILLLGDSAVFGFGVSQDKTYSTLLQRALRERCPQQPVDVLNGARPGTKTRTGLFLLQHRWKDLRPDLLIVAYNNDSFHKEALVDYSPPPWLLHARQALYRSAVYRTVALAMTVDWLTSRDMTFFGPKQPALVVFQHNLQQMVELEKSWHGRTMFVSMPRCAPSPGTPYEHSLTPEFREAARNLISREGEMFLDMASDDSFPQKDAAMFIIAKPDEVHFSEAGHRLMAQKLCDYILQRHLIPGT